MSEREKNIDRSLRSASLITFIISHISLSFHRNVRWRRWVIRVCTVPTFDIRFRRLSSDFTCIHPSIHWLRSPLHARRSLCASIGCMHLAKRRRTVLLSLMPGATRLALACEQLTYWWRWDDAIHGNGLYVYYCIICVSVRWPEGHARFHFNFSRSHSPPDGASISATTISWTSGEYTSNQHRCKYTSSVQSTRFESVSWICILHRVCCGWVRVSVSAIWLLFYFHLSHRLMLHAMMSFRKQT